MSSTEKFKGWPLGHFCTHILRFAVECSYIKWTDAVKCCHVGPEWHLDQGTGLNPTTLDSVGLVHSLLGGDSLCIIECWLTLSHCACTISLFMLSLGTTKCSLGEKMAMAEDWF